PKSHKSSGSYGDSVVVEEFQRTVKEEVALEKAKRQTKKKKKKKKESHLEKLKAKASESITEQFLKERKERGEERGRAKHSKFRMKKKQLNPKSKIYTRQEVFFPSELLRLRSRSSPVYKAFTEQYRKIKKETEGELRIWHCHELCCRLQAQVIQCSRENT
uniref:Uncharacterized protein n=1 Tax=Sus scrofa TaxID=9823 RepID=A0A8D1M7W5_PIG